LIIHDFTTKVTKLLFTHYIFLTLNTLRTYGTLIVRGNIFSTNILSLTGQKATLVYPIWNIILVEN